MCWLLWILLACASNSLTVKASEREISYSETSETAAVLADSWSSQQDLLYDKTQAIKPETSPVHEQTEEVSAQEDAAASDEEIVAHMWEQLTQPELDAEDYLNSTNNANRGKRVTMQHKLRGVHNLSSSFYETRTQPCGRPFDLCRRWSKSNSDRILQRNGDAMQINVKLQTITGQHTVGSLA